MIRRRIALLMLCGGLVAGCASAAPATEATPTAAPLADTASPSSGTASASTPTPAAAAPATPSITLGEADMPLDAGTHEWVLERPGIEFPKIRFTVPEGWASQGRFTYRVPPGSGEIPVAMGFWDVGQVYGHPCRWAGTLFDPGPTVDDLVTALVDRPLRNATAPVDVTLDGYAGRYLEWSVPSDIDFEDCEVAGGSPAFESWTGDPAGWGGDRYHQGPGQLDRLWIVDVDGVRFVVDAFSMPSATEAEIAELISVVESIRFER